MTARDLAARSGAGKRAELVEAAIRVSARVGVHATTTRKIADESGLPLGTVHYWFASKEQLLEEVLRETMGRMEAAVEQASSGAADVGQDLLEELRAAWRVAEEDPLAQLALYEMTCLALRTPNMRELAERQYALYRGIAKRAAERWLDRTRARRPKSTDALATLLASTVDGLVLAWLADPDGTDVDGALTILSDSLNALTRPAGRMRRAQGGAS